MSVVSVVVPVYNAEKYLGNCLESIINQTLSDIEIILVNDGSTDDSGRICEEYSKKDSRIVYIEQKNQGVSVARNTGKDAASGEYILFADADDELRLDMLEKLYSDAQKYNADIAVCKIQKIRTKEEIASDTVENIEICKMSQDEAMKSYLTESKLEIGVWNKLFRKSVIESINYYVGRKMNEDKFFAFESIMASKIITYRDEPLYYYYVRNDSVTKQKFDKKWFDNIYFAEKIYNIIVDTKPDLEAAARYQMVMTKYYLVLNMKRNHAEHNFSDEYKKLKHDIKKTKIDDLNINKRQRTGILMIKYCDKVFEIVKSIQK